MCQESQENLDLTPIYVLMAVLAITKWVSHVLCLDGFGKNFGHKKTRKLYRYRNI